MSCECSVMAFVLSARGPVCRCASSKPAAVTHAPTLRVLELTEETSGGREGGHNVDGSGGGGGDNFCITAAGAAGIFPEC